MAPQGVAVRGWMLVAPSESLANQGRAVLTSSAVPTKGGFHVGGVGDAVLVCGVGVHGGAVGGAQVEAVLGDEFGVHDQVFVFGGDGGLEVLENRKDHLNQKNPPGSWVFPM